MVTVEYIRAAARRHDTVMAWAFRRALGVDGIRRRPRAGRSPDLRYRGVGECFANRGRSPVEW